jgi:hypothetical protein
MALDREYRIGASARKCQACERVFCVGDEYFSAVAETKEDDLFERRDLCPACWKPEAAYFSFWKTRVSVPEQAQTHGPRIDMGRLLQLFEHLAESPDEKAQRFRYVLALVLMRKRRMRILESKRLPGGGEKLTLREVGTGRTHEIACPSISEEEIRSVADRLREILDMPEKWDQVQTAEAAPAAESAAKASTDELAAESPTDESAETGNDMVVEEVDKVKYDDDDEKEEKEEEEEELEEEDDDEFEDDEDDEDEDDDDDEEWDDDDDEEEDDDE